MPEIDTRAIKAAAGLYHSYFTGLILTLVTSPRAPEAAEWVFRLFRHQHHEKFLSSFDKLGLKGMPDAVACAAFHYLSNQIGGVEVEFMRESERKAWVNFVPPRWIYPGASICAVPSEVSRAFLRGWYAHNGVSLANPRLGFVCTAQTTDGQHGLSGYFLDHGRELAEDERLSFRPGELPPPFDPSAAPRTAGGRLAARTAGQSRAQLCHGVHPLRSATAGRTVRTGRGRPPRRTTGRLIGAAAIQGDGGSARHRGGRRGGVCPSHAAAGRSRGRCGGTGHPGGRRHLWCVGRAGG